MNRRQQHKNDNHRVGGRSCRRQLLPILFINETGVSKAHPCLPPTIRLSFLQLTIKV